MSEQVEERIHPPAIVAAGLAGFAWVLVAFGFEWAWLFSLTAVMVAACAEVSRGGWTRVLALCALVGGTIASGVAVMLNA